MASELIYAFRVMRLPLLDSDRSEIGRIVDIVLLPPNGDDPPQVVGFVAASQRRRIFVNAARLAYIDNAGAHLRSSSVDLNPFKKRHAEILVSELLDARHGTETVGDIALRASVGRISVWEVAAVRLTHVAGTLRRRRQARVVDWREVTTLFGSDPVAVQAAAMRGLHPAEMATRLRALPFHQRQQLAEVMEDERLADLLEELPESEQLRIIEGLDTERLISVLEEMEYDDAADLIAEMPGEQRTQVLDQMDPDEAKVIRRLLTYEEATAGGLMNPDVIVLGAQATVAEALAQIRDPDWSSAVAAQVFVVQPPFATPTGRYLGVVHFQRLLREAPSMELGKLVATEPTVSPDLPDTEVAERLAAYNLLAIAVTDEEERILGIITVDDVLDRTLPTGWRQRQRQLARSS
jgi:CBS domain-containing protein